MFSWGDSRKKFQGKISSPFSTVTHSGTSSKAHASLDDIMPCAYSVQAFLHTACTAIACSQFSVLLGPVQIPKNFAHYSSHQILRHMHGVLNVDEKKTNYTVSREIVRRIF